MKIAILTSGGDCSGMNPAIKSFVEVCYSHDVTPYFVYDGLEGLIDNRIQVASHSDVAGIIYRGGTIIRSSRSQRFYEKKQRELAHRNLKSHGITKLVVLGGDGSFKALDLFHSEFGIEFIGIPSTIDNDIYGSDYCLGVDTALNVIAHCIDNIRDTASSFKRAFIIETMGHKCGYLALVSALTSGAEVCAIPELPLNLKNLETKLLGEIEQGRNYLIVVCAEGLNRAKELQEWSQNTLGFESRITTLGHVQRGGNPSVFDRLMASEFVTLSLQRLIASSSNHHAVVYARGKFDFIEIETINNNTYTIPSHLLEAGKPLSLA
jgi:6-phosphofructokinase 1